MYMMLQQSTPVSSLHSLVHPELPAGWSTTPHALSACWPLTGGLEVLRPDTNRANLFRIPVKASGSSSSSDAQLDISPRISNDTLSPIQLNYIVYMEEDAPPAARCPSIHAAAIVGGVLGGLIFVGLLLFVAAFFLRKRAQNRRVSRALWFRGRWLENNNHPASSSPVRQVV
ncbi:hypothetical protein MKEN_00501300 [Mycena kentingensis (nom. inval.)]|nr:hypothetical protein MKEN_00501300 [Mycena kentingensis (nom. inval.)]